MVKGIIMLVHDNYSAITNPKGNHDNNYKYFDLD